MFNKLIQRLLGNNTEHELKKMWPIVRRINDLEPKLAGLSDASLRKLLRELAEEGLLAIGSGRQGTRLTDAGRCALTRPELPQSVCSADK